MSSRHPGVSGTGLGTGSAQLRSGLEDCLELTQLVAHDEDVVVERMVGPRYTSSSASRTLAASLSMVNGFWRKFT